jgi:hypothetical protein
MINEFFSAVSRSTFLFILTNSTNTILVYTIERSSASLGTVIPSDTILKQLWLPAAALTWMIMHTSRGFARLRRTWLRSIRKHENVI